MKKITEHIICNKLNNLAITYYDKKYVIVTIDIIVYLLEKTHLINKRFRASK